MAGKILLQQALQKPYERRVFITEILQPVFQNKLQIPTSPIDETPDLTQSETSLIKQVLRYGSIALDDDTDIVCYEIMLHDAVRLEQNRISIQQYVRKLMVAGDVMLLSFVQQKSPTSWRLSLVASDTKVSDTGEIKAIKTNAKRYTYLLGQAESCLTAASQLAVLESKSNIERKDIIEAFAVEKVSKPFFDEYTKVHYRRFNDYLMASNFKAAVFNGDEKAMRDFVKKLLGRIVFLYFVQKKGWLGAKEGFASSEAFLKNTSKSEEISEAFPKGNSNFIMNLFTLSGGDETFYSLWLSELFFNALNAPRPNDAFVMPDKTVVKIPFLNGGLFEKDKHDEHFLTFPPQFFHNTDNPESDKERGFLDFLNAYNFTVYEDSPDDHTVAVDPEMLGHIFENLLEDNKDKGAFYTPKEIVHYMCQESLIEYLTAPTAPPAPRGGAFSNSPEVSLKSENEFLTPPLGRFDASAGGAVRGAIEALIKHQRVSEGLLPHLKTISHKLETVRICDPAIGSGAFPMGLLHEIFNAKILLHQAIEGVSPTPTQRVAMKLHIIQNSIYGVDIERGAVDIARLRFWLSLIVDEQTPKALPNLDYKIVVGNSLVSKFEDEVIAIDWDRKVSAGKAHDFVQNIQRLLKEVADKQRQYFDAEVNKKQALTSKIRALKLELLINQFSFNKDKYMNTTPSQGSAFPTAKEIKANTERLLTIANFDNQIKKLQTLQQHPERPFLHFDWKLDFPEVLNPHLVAENGGFDIVIGNPPYFNVETLGVKSSYVEEIKTKYAEIWMDKSDILFYFINQGIELVKKNSNVFYIISNAFLFSEKAQKLRNYILQKAPIQRIVNFEKYLVFDSAMITTAIVHFGKSKNNTIIDALTLKNPKENFELAVKDPNGFIKVELKPNNVFALVNDETEKLNTKIDNKKIPLGELVLVGSGMQTAAIEVFSNLDIMNQNFDIEFLKKRLNGKAIKKYFIDDSYTDDMIYFENVNSFENLPKNIQQYLLSHKAILENRATVKNEGRVWWRYSRPMHKDYYHLNKIWTSYRGANNCFAFDDTGFHIGLTNTTVIFDTNSKVVSLKYILALLNSKVLNYRYKSIGKQTGGGIFEYFENGISKLPIPQLPTKQQKPFEMLVNQILIDKKAGKNTEVLEADIDRLVYELYELTAAEIAVVEGR